MFNQVNTNKIYTEYKFKEIIRNTKAIEQSEGVFLDIIKNEHDYIKVLGVKMNLKWMFSSELETK